MSRKGWENPGGITTKKGKVNYPRPKNLFDAKRIAKIIESYNNRIEIEEARSAPTNQHIRNVFKLSKALYRHVNDQFSSNYGELSEQEDEAARRIVRQFNETVIDIVAEWFLAKTGSPIAAGILRRIGYYINDALEDLIAPKE